MTRELEISMFKKRKRKSMPEQLSEDYLVTTQGLGRGIDPKSWMLKI